MTRENFAWIEENFVFLNKKKAFTSKFLANQFRLFLEILLTEKPCRIGELDLFIDLVADHLDEQHNHSLMSSTLGAIAQAKKAIHSGGKQEAGEKSLGLFKKLQFALPEYKQVDDLVTHLQLGLMWLESQDQ